MGYDNPFDPSRGGPIMSGLLRALQAKAMIENLKNDALDRQYREQELGFRREQLGETNRRADERLQFDMGKEGYRQSDDALKNTVELHKLGAQFGNPGVEQFLNATFGAPKDPRMAVQTPTGQTAYLPTAREQKQTKLQQIIDTAKLGTAEALNAQALLAPGRLKEKIAEREIALRYPSPTAPPTNRVIQTEKGGVIVDRQGNTVGINPDLKKSPTAATAAQDPEGERKRVQKIIDEAKRVGEVVRLFESNPKAEWTAQQKNEYLKAKSQSVILWQQAAREAAMAAQRFPDKLEGGEGADGYAFIKPR